MGWSFGVLFLIGADISLFNTASSLAAVSTSLLLQWVLGAFSAEVKWPELDDDS
jgi:hypothetical protein